MLLKRADVFISPMKRSHPELQSVMLHLSFSYVNQHTSALSLLSFRFFLQLVCSHNTHAFISTSMGEFLLEQSMHMLKITFGDGLSSLS